MIGDVCGVCAAPIREGQVELSVPHISEPDTHIHGVCPARRLGEGSK